MALGSGPIEAKVSAATIAAALSSLVVWVLQTRVFAGEVPAPVSAAVQVVVPALCAFVAGWAARHTPRGDLDALPPTGEYAAFDDDPDDGRHSRHEP